MVLYPNKLPESERVCFGICKRSTAVLSGEYSSTSTEVLEPGEIVAVLITECLAWNCFILVYPSSV